MVSTSDKFTLVQLASTYVGAMAEAAWAVGLGANVLVGGCSALQPLSAKGLNGANLAGGVTEVVLSVAK